MSLNPNVLNTHFVNPYLELLTKIDATIENSKRIIEIYKDKKDQKEKNQIISKKPYLLLR